MTAPPPADGSETVALLAAAEAGDVAAFDRLFTRVYDELYALAHQVRRGRAGETLGTTALVHEAYLKLLPSRGGTWQDRGHFLAVAARAMRQVLVGAARARLAEKRGGADGAVSLDPEGHPAPVRPEQLLALDEALGELAALDARQARVVEYRIFVGLTAEETAAVLGVSTPTVQRDWRAARAYLARALEAA